MQCPARIFGRFSKSYDLQLTSARDRPKGCPPRRLPSSSGLDSFFHKIAPEAHLTFGLNLDTSLRRRSYACKATTLLSSLPSRQASSLGLDERLSSTDGTPGIYDFVWILVTCFDKCTGMLRAAISDNLMTFQQSWPHGGCHYPSLLPCGEHIVKRGT